MASTPDLAPLARWLPAGATQTSQFRARLRLTELERRDHPGSLLDALLLGLAAAGGPAIGDGVEPPATAPRPARPASAEPDRASKPTPRFDPPLPTPGLSQRTQGGSQEQPREVRAALPVDDELATFWARAGRGVTSMAREAAADADSPDPVTSQPVGARSGGSAASVPGVGATEPEPTSFDVPLGGTGGPDGDPGDPPAGGESEYLPEVYISGGGDADEEGLVTGGFDVIKSDGRMPSPPVTVYFQRLGGTATPDVDYTGLPEFFSYTFPEDSHHIVVPFFPVQDELLEGPESVKIKILDHPTYIIQDYGPDINWGRQRTQYVQDNDAAVSDYVWVDESADGIQQYEEEPLENAKVELFVATDPATPLMSQFTGVDGKYDFRVLNSRVDYLVQVTKPADDPDKYLFTTPNAGPDTVDSDADASGSTGWFDVLDGEDANHKDVGLIDLPDLDIIDSNGNVVAENKENDPGGFVAVNNDNDNYNFDPTATMTQVFDKDENGQVADENDLLGIRVQPFSRPAGTGELRLEWTSAKIKVWRAPDKGGAGPVTSGTAMPLNQATNLWVEGLSMSSAMRVEDIGLRWTGPGGGSDHINLTVYLVRGPGNVPGHSDYEYRVTIPDRLVLIPPIGVQTHTPKIDNVVHGHLTNSITFPSDDPITRGFTIHWDGGPAVGKYRAYPDQLLPNFFVERSVNVVQVAIGKSSITYGNPPTQTADLRFIASTPTAAIPAMKAEYTIDRIEGPLNQRGVRFVEVGGMQTLQFTKKHAEFGTLQPPRKRVDSLEGVETYLDTINNREFPDRTDHPWYNSSLAYFSSSGDDRGAPFTSLGFLFSDRPRLAATDVMDLTHGGATAGATKFRLVADFEAYIAVHTLDEILDPYPTRDYAQRGKAKWQFDGTGDINLGGGWTLTGGGNTGDAKFTEVTNGSPVYYSNTTVTANFALPGTWSTV